MADDKKPESPFGKPRKPNKPSGDSPWSKPGSGPARPPKGSGPRIVKPGERKPDLDKYFPGMRPSRRGGPGGGRGQGPQVDMPNVPKWAFFAVPLALLAFTSVYTVDAGERAAVLRFGDLQRTAGPGLNFKLPYPIETKQLVNVQRQRDITVGQTDEESLMVTGDENIVDLEFTILYRINNLDDFLFEVENPDDLVKVTAESVVREIVGRNDLEDIITTQRARLIAEVSTELQALLDEYEAGVQISDVQFQRTDPPEGDVQQAFNRVVASDQEAAAAVNSAQAEFNQVTLNAQGRALAIIQEAEAYRDQVIAISEGEAQRFTQVYNEYKLAPEVTRRRIYLETMEEIYSGADKIILDGEAGSGAVPYLPLDQLNRRGGTQ